MERKTRPSAQVSSESHQVPTSGPLEGIRVIDAGSVLAGPIAGTILGDFGAEVIKIELPNVGDVLRHVPPQYQGVSLWWAVEGRNKKCITLDLRKLKGQDAFKRLVSVSDIIVENFLPGTFEKWHLSYEELRSVNKGIILVRCSGFGQEGPYSKRAGYDRAAQAIGGLMYLTGYPNSPPVRAGLSIVDYGTAVFSVLGALLALHYRNTLGWGEGQVVDCALYETVLRMYENHLPVYDKLGIVPERKGNVHAAAVPGDLFQSKDGRLVFISIANDRLFADLVKAIGQEELSHDPRFKTVVERTQHTEFLNNKVREWASKHFLKEIVDILEEHQICVGPLYTAKDIAEDEHFKQRGSVIEVEDRRIGKVKMQGVVPKLSLTPGKVRHTGRDLGEDTYAVLSQLLKYSDHEIERLKAEQVI